MRTTIKFTALIMSLLIFFSALVSCEKQNRQNTGDNTSDTNPSEKQTASDTGTAKPSEKKKTLLDFNPLKDAYWGDYGYPMVFGDCVYERKIYSNKGEVFINHIVDKITSSVPKDTYTAVYISIEPVSDELKTKQEFRKHLHDIGIIEDVLKPWILYYATADMLEMIKAPENARVTVFPAECFYHENLYAFPDTTDKEIEEMELFDDRLYNVTLHTELSDDIKEFINANSNYGYMISKDKDSDIAIWKEKVWPIFEEILKDNGINDEFSSDLIYDWDKAYLTVSKDTAVKLMKEKRFSKVWVNLHYSNLISDSDKKNGRIN